MKRIAVLIDFTSICEIAVEHAAVVVRYTKTPVTLVHVAEEGMQGQEKEIKARMKEHAIALDREEIPYMLKVGYGEFFSTIPTYLQQIGADFVLVGTHGIKGIADASYGLNIIRLIGSMKQPTLIVQGHSEAPQEGYDNMMIPMVGTNVAIPSLPEIIDHGKHYDARFTVLQFLEDDSQEDEQRAFYLKQFEDNQTPVQYEAEEVSSFTNAFARSIMQYASIEDINLVIWVSPRDGNQLNDEDKENLILNRFGVGVLFIP